MKKLILILCSIFFISPNFVYGKSGKFQIIKKELGTVWILNTENGKVKVCYFDSNIARDQLQNIEKLKPPKCSKYSVLD